MFFKTIHSVFLLAFIFFVPLAGIMAQPGNDNPCGAIQLIANVGNQCTPAGPIFWSDATATPGFADPGCADYSTGDIWFKFILTDPSDIFITTLKGNGASAITDGGMALYYNDQDCDSNFFFKDCDDDDGLGSMPQIELMAQPAGTYYIRFWDYDDKTSGDIEGICVAANPVAANTINDDPCTATELNIIDGEVCTPSTPVSWMDATATGGIGLPGCGSYTTGDIWFSFTLTDTSDIYVSTAEGVDPGAIVDGALSVYGADACDGSLVEIYCANDQGSDLMPKLVVPALLPGLYFIRFWDVDDKRSGNIGGICVAFQQSVVYAVENDDPCGAKELIVVSDTACIPDNPQFWTNATATVGIDAPYCGSYTTGDVWYKFSLTEASDIFITTKEGNGAGTFSDAAMALYKADACDGTFVFLFCDDDAGPGNMPQIEQLAIPAGDYLIRVWDYADGVTGNIGGICVAALPTISTSPNDICITALPFPEIPADGNCSTVSVNTAGATGNVENFCGGIADDDVWYSFIVPNGITLIGFEITANGEPFTETFRLYRGNCDNQFFLGCFASDQGIFPELTEGQIYFIRTFTTGVDTAAQYDICLRALMSPSNDDPCGAITLIPLDNANDCTADDPVSWEFASASVIASDPGCGSYETGDVWFKFELTYNADIVVRTSAGNGPYGITDGAMALYKKISDCNQLDLIACNDDATPTNLMPAISDFDLAPGVYYVRLWDYYDNISGNIGGICVSVTPTISTKENDQCDGALPFPIIPTDGTCASVHVNNVGATGSISSPLPGFNDDDLWYSFVVPAGVDRLLYEITTNTGNAQHIVCLYDGCGSHASFQCSSYPYIESGEFTGLVEGFTYILNVYTPEINVFSDFNVCLKTVPPPPSNDECSGAIAFPVIPVDGSCSTVSVNTTWATSSGIFACGGLDDDVWYSFVVPDNVTELVPEFITIGRGEREGFELFEGDCDHLVSIQCVDDYAFQSLNIYNLNPGQTYYLRVFTDAARLFVFDLCLSVPPTPPVNDLCPDAISFPEIPTDGSCATMVATTIGATGDNSEGCYSIFDDDVWFSFVMPDGFTGIHINTTPLTGAVSFGVGIYSGDCDNLEFIGCYAARETVLQGLVGGQTYYVRAYTLFTNVDATFEICIAVTPLPPVNDDCSGAIAFPDIPLNGDWVSVEGSTLSGTDSGLAACNGYADDDLWLSFVVPAGQDRLLFRHGFDFGLVLELFSGDCDHLEFIDCFGSSNSSTAFLNLVSEQRYYLRVYNIEQNEFSNYKIELSVPQPLLNDFCDGALEFPPIPIDGSCVSLSANSVFATSSGVTGCGSVPNNDVWFKFTVPDDFYAVILDLQSDFNSVDIQVFGGSCGDLISMECLQSPILEDISGLEPGETYWIQAFPAIGVADVRICLSVPPLRPVNDDCPDATSITGAPGIFVDPGLQTTAGATDSHVPICFPFGGGGNDETYDVWYSFVTDQDGGNATVTITFNETSGGGYNFFNLNMQGFDGVCGGFTTLSCLENEIGVSGYQDSTIVMKLFGLAPNTTYYFRVFPTGSTHNYAPVDFTVFAEGTALEGITAIEDHGTGHQGLEITRFYPSPAHNVLHIDYAANAQAKAQLVVTDLLGHVIQQKELLTRQGENHETLLFDQIPSGLYIIYIENEKGRSQPKRFVLE